MERDYIKLAREGDEQALNFLINKHRNYAYSIALTVCKKDQLAKDIVQEAFVNVFISIKNFRNESKFSTWLYKIVYREAVKQSKNIPKTFENYSSEPIYFDNVERDLSNEQLGEILKKALYKLNDKERVILELFYLNEKKIKEIKSITGLNEKYIKVLLHRGRKSLKSVIEESFGNDLINLI